jgi:carbon monoxide dehydrogenase subunit G
MQIATSYRFAAAPQEVWHLLMDPHAIQACLPGCRELQPIDEHRYHADISIGVGAVSGVFSSTVTLSDLVAPHGYRIAVAANGKTGFASGSATVLLKAVEAGTQVEVAGTVAIGGLVARVGQRLIEGVARTTVDRFFNCLAARLGSRIGG